MKLTLALLLIPTLGFTQIMIGQLTEGEYFSEVVYEGTYYSQGICSFPGDFDFSLDINSLSEISGMDYAFIVDAPNPINTPLFFLGQPVNIGDSTILNPVTTNTGLTAGSYPNFISPPAQLSFHIRLLGTPTNAGEICPCWIDQIGSLAECQNSLILFDGPTTVPCSVQTIIGIQEERNPTNIGLENGRLVINSPGPGQLNVFSAEGRLIHSSSLSQGKNTLSIDEFQGLILVQTQTDKGGFTRKILLQK